MATVTLQNESDAATAWNEALQSWRTALFLANRASEEEDRAFKAYRAAAPDDQEIEAKVRRWFPYQVPRAIVQTDDLEQMWEQFVAGRNKVWFARDPKARENAFREVLNEIAAYRKARDEADIATGRSLVSDRYDAAWNAENEARVRLMATPAPDAEAAIAKLDLLFGAEAMESEGGYSPSWAAHYVLPTIADVKRLLSVAA